MKRRAHGVNLDDGVELWSAEDFEWLYVPARPAEDERLREWLADPKAESLIVAGQIGAGKTTFLNSMLRQAASHSTVRVEFDQVPLEETQGAFLSVLFGSLLREGLNIGCSCEGIGIALSDFDPSGPRSWEDLRDLLLIAPPSVTEARRARALYAVFDENPRQGQRACAGLLQRIEREIGLAPSIVAEGVDKFAISRAGYLGLAEILDFLSDYKTLYEANAIHLFDSGHKWVSSQKVFIGPLREETVAAMYEKRLGDYAAVHRGDFPFLVQYSGGNARQALRLLNGYYFRRTQLGNGRDAALALAAHQVSQDLLQFGFDRFPAELLAILKRDGYVEAGVLTAPKTSPDAHTILYRNWAFLQTTPGAGTTRWPVVINPLVSNAVAWEKVTPEPPELTAVRRWARDHQISPMGMSLPEDEKGRPRAWQEIWEQLASSESFAQLNIARLLEEVASSLFSANRQDRIMVSYRDPRNLDIALDYLIGKAATYGPFKAREIHLVGGEGNDPIAIMMTEIREKDEATIYAIFMDGSWTPAQLDALERLRDRLIYVQMLWFVEHMALLRYLRHWPQLRQLFRFYVLEDDFLSPLSREEIEADLSSLSSVYGPEDRGIGRLQHVLQYLER